MQNLNMEKAKPNITVSVGPVPRNLNAKESVDLVKWSLDFSLDTISKDSHIPYDTLRTWHRRGTTMRESSRKLLVDYLRHQIEIADSARAYAFVKRFLEWVASHRMDDYGPLVNEIGGSAEMGDGGGQTSSMEVNNSAAGLLTRINNGDEDLKSRAAMACSTFYTFGKIGASGNDPGANDADIPILDYGAQDAVRGTGFSSDPGAMPRIAPGSRSQDSGYMSLNLPLFRRSLPQRALQRPQQKSEIIQWWEEKSQSGFPILMVCGRPGSGRNTLVDQAITDMATENNSLVDIFEVVFDGSLISTLGGCVISKKKGTKKRDRFDFAIEELERLYRHGEQKCLLVLRNVYGSSEEVSDLVQGSEMDALVRTGACVVITTPCNFFIKRCWQVRLSDLDGGILSDYLVELVHQESGGLESISADSANRIVECLDRNLGGITACARFLGNRDCKDHGEGFAASLEEAIGTQIYSKSVCEFIDVLKDILKLDRLGQKSCDVIKIFGTLPAGGVEQSVLFSSGADVSEVRNLTKLGILESVSTSGHGSHTQMIRIADRQVYLVSIKEAHVSIKRGDDRLRKIHAYLTAPRL